MLEVTLMKSEITPKVRNGNIGLTELEENDSIFRLLLFILKQHISKLHILRNK